MLVMFMKSNGLEMDVQGQGQGQEKEQASGAMPHNTTPRNMMQCHTM
jgi:hypothetical protein